MIIETRVALKALFLLRVWLWALFAAGTATCQLASASVLVIGDSISLGWMPHAESLLPEVEFVHARDGSGTNNHGTKLSLIQALGVTDRKIDIYVEQRESWDLIIFNAGIHDLRSDSFHGTTAAEYRDNLHQIYDVLEAQNAPILWLTTTPVPEDHHSSDWLLQPGHREVAINIANSRADGVVDLFAAMHPEFERFQIEPGNLHYNTAGSKFLAELVTDAVSALETPSEFYYTEGDAPIWPEGIFNPNPPPPPPPPPPPLFSGVDFLTWQRDPEGPGSAVAAVMGGDNFLSWQRVEGSRPLYKRTPVNGHDFLQWQRYETELQRGNDAVFNSQQYLGWQRFGSRAFEGVLGDGPIAAQTVPEPATLTLLLLSAGLPAWRILARSR